VGEVEEVEEVGEVKEVEGVGAKTDDTTGYHLPASRWLVRYREYQVMYDEADG
jgi:hypothetical protein